MLRNVKDEITDNNIIKRIKDEIAIGRKQFPIRILENIRKSKLKIKCWTSSLQLTVDSFGDVYICCYYRHRLQKHKLGNMLEKPLKEIWYSKTHWDKIADINIDECNKYDCRFHFYNELMEELIIKDKAQLNFI
mgnify:FL=1